MRSDLEELTEFDSEGEEDVSARYVITKKIGSGSFGAVYKATKRRLGKDGVDDDDEDDDVKALEEERETFAIKIIPIDDNANKKKKKNEGDEDELKKKKKKSLLYEREIALLELSRHPNVTKMFESFVRERLQQMWIVMEFCGGGAVRDILNSLMIVSVHESRSSSSDNNNRRVGFREDVIAFVCDECLKGLQYLHERGRLHRDIKCGNILLTRDGRVKLADFGVATQLGERNMKAKTFVGTPHWMAPEVISESANDDVDADEEDEIGDETKKQTIDGIVVAEGDDLLVPVGGVDDDVHKSRGYDGKVDIWALGISAIEMAETQPPRHDMHPMRVIFKIAVDTSPELKNRGEWTLSFHDFIAQALKRDPRARASAKTLRKHDFFEFHRKNGRSKAIAARVNKGGGIIDINRIDEWYHARQTLVEELIPLGLMHKKEKLEEKYGNTMNSNGGGGGFMNNNMVNAHRNSKRGSDHSGASTMRKSNSGSDIYGTMIYRSNKSVGGSEIEGGVIGKNGSKESIEKRVIHHGENKTSAEILSAALNDQQSSIFIKKNNSIGTMVDTTTTMIKNGVIENNVAAKSGLPLNDLRRMVLGRDEKEEFEREKLRALALKKFQRDALLLECLEFASSKKTMDTGAHDTKNYNAVVAAASKFFANFNIDSDDDTDDDDTDDEIKSVEFKAKKLLASALQIESSLR